MARADLIWRGLAQSRRAPNKLAEFWRGVVGRRPSAMALEAREASASAAPWIGRAAASRDRARLCDGARRTQAIVAPSARPFPMPDSRDRGMRSQHVFGLL